MGWIAFGVGVAGFLVALGLESLGYCIIFASGRWDEYEAHKEAEKEKKDD